MTAPCNHKWWEIWCIDNDETREDAELVKAEDAYSASVQWATFYDDLGVDPIIIDNTQPMIFVAEKGSSKIFKMIVTGVSVPVYSARLIASDDPE